MVSLAFNSPRLFSASTALVAAFAAAGIWFLSSKDWFFGTFASIMAAWTGFLHEGIDFDLDCKRYRFYKGLHHWKIGAWQQLPTIVGVTIKYFSDLTTTEDETGFHTNRNARIILMLSVASSSQGIIIQQFALAEKKSALMMGEEIADIFEVPLATFI